LADLGVDHRSTDGSFDASHPVLDVAYGLRQTATSATTIGLVTWV
jgi:hypothetical protein